MQALIKERSSLNLLYHNLLKEYKNLSDGLSNKDEKASDYNKKMIEVQKGGIRELTNANGILTNANTDLYQTLLSIVRSFGKYFQKDPNITKQIENIEKEKDKQKQAKLISDFLSKNKKK